MFGARDRKEYILDNFSNDRSMAFSSADDYEELSRKIDRLREDGVDIDDMDHYEIMKYGE